MHYAGPMTNEIAKAIASNIHYLLTSIRRSGIIDAQRVVLRQYGVEVGGQLAFAAEPRYLGLGEPVRLARQHYRVAQHHGNVVRFLRPGRRHLHQQLGRVVRLGGRVGGEARVPAAVPGGDVLQHEQRKKLFLLLADLQVRRDRGAVLFPAEIDRHIAGRHGTGQLCPTANFHDFWKCKRFYYGWAYQQGGSERKRDTMQSKGLVSIKCDSSATPKLAIGFRRDCNTYCVPLIVAPCALRHHSVRSRCTCTVPDLAPGRRYKFSNIRHA